VKPRSAALRLPDFVEPMKAKLVGSMPVGAWIYELSSTVPEGGRKYFGSLLVGFYEGKNLKFAGRVGTGFSDQLLRSLCSDLEKIRIEQCPFFNVPAVGRSRWDQGLTARQTPLPRGVVADRVENVNYPTASSATFSCFSPGNRKRLSKLVDIRHSRFLAGRNVNGYVCILGEALYTSSSPVGGWKIVMYLSISALGISNAPSGRFRFRSSKRRYNSEYGTSI
jgi:hypothetical protein